MDGRIKLHRKILDWGWYSDTPTRSVFLHLLFLCTHKEYIHIGLKLLPGQCIVGRKILAKSLGLTEMQIRRAITNLKVTNEITSKTTNKYSIITVLKWAEYQTEENKTTNKITNSLSNKQPTNNQQTTTEQEHKNIRIDNSDFSEPIEIVKQTKSIINILNDKKLEELRGLDLLQEFVDYWSETDSKGNEKRTKQKTWSLNLRLKKRKNNKDTNFGKNPIKDYEDLTNFHYQRIKEAEPIKIFFRNKYGENWIVKYNETKTKYKQTDLYLKY